MAEIVGRSPTLVYKWADPDLAYFPNLQQALELDAAYVNAGHGSPPLLTAYATLLKQRTAKAVQHPGEALADAVRLINVACEVLSEISGQVQRASDPEHTKSSPRCNICENLRRLGELQASLSWNMENNTAEIACPLHRKGAADVECSIGKGPAESSGRKRDG
jgi:hypothetical protein